MWVNHGSAISTYRLVLSHFCLTLCNPMDCSPRGSSVHGGSTGKNTGVGCHALLQGIFTGIKSASPVSTALQADWAITAEPREQPLPTSKPLLFSSSGLYKYHRQTLLYSCHYKLGTFFPTGKILKSQIQRPKTIYTSNGTCCQIISQRPPKSSPPLPSWENSLSFASLLYIM